MNAINHSIDETDPFWVGGSRQATLDLLIKHILLLQDKNRTCKYFIITICIQILQERNSTEPLPQDLHFVKERKEQFFHTCAYILDRIKYFEACEENIKKSKVPVRYIDDTGAKEKIKIALKEENIFKKDKRKTKQRKAKKTQEEQKNGSRRTKNVPRKAKKTQEEQKNGSRRTKNVPRK
jgi:hypothetical protein